MAQRVESFPSGLRELLGRGDPPPQFTFLPEVFLPSIEVSKFFLLNKRQSQSIVADVTSAPLGFGATTVPNDELWWMQRIVVQTDVLDADQAIEFTGAMQINGVFFHAQNVAVAASSRDALILTLPPAEPLILRGGDDFRLSAVSVTIGAAGAVNCQVNSLYYVLR